jgi:hypothetical protein
LENNHVTTVNIQVHIVKLLFWELLSLPNVDAASLVSDKVVSANTIPKNTTIITAITKEFVMS